MHPDPRFAFSSVLALALSSVASAQFHEVYTHVGSLDDQAGRGVAGVGDIDGDGVGDYAVGHPFDEFFGNVKGKVVLYSGKTGDPIRAHSGEADGDRFGWSVDGVGDVNHDGFDDYLIGAPYRDEFGFTDCGKAYAFSGKTGGPIWATVYAQDSALTGYSVCGPGDVNADGTPDYAVGTPYADDNGLFNNGRVSVLSGAGTPGLWTRYGVASYDLFGYSIDGVGDITGDGRLEIVVGAPYEDVFTTNNGRGYVLNGANGSTVFSRFGAWTEGYLGWSVAGIGDVNADGKPDVAFGEPYADTNGTDSGRVLVSSGQSPYLMLNEVTGGAGILVGYEVAGLGDADGDGRPDYACSAPFANFFTLVDVGWIYLISGASGSSFATLTGQKTGDFIGINVDGVGDLNGDGFTDMIVGAPWSNVNGTDSGLARVILNKVPFPDDYCTSKVNSAGCTPMIEHAGTPSASIADDFHVGAQSILYNVPGILIWSLGSAATPFGGGILCVASPVQRTPGQSSGGVVSDPCSGSFDFHFSQAYMAGQGLIPGTLVYAQYWSRDNGFALPNNMNLTEGLKFTVIP